MKRPLWLLVGIGLLWPLVGIDAEAAQLCCLAEGPHWRSVEGRRCYTDRWRSKSELRWCGAKPPRGGLAPTPTAPQRGAQEGAQGGPATKSVPFQPDPALRAPAWILDWQREILWRTIEDLDREAPPAPLADPTSTLRAFDEARGAAHRLSEPRLHLRPNLGGPLLPPPEVPMPRPRPLPEPPSEGDRVSPGAPFSAQPPLVPSGQLPTPAWSWLGLLLATLMLGTAATEDLL